MLLDFRINFKLKFSGLLKITQTWKMQLNKNKNV